MLIYNDIFSNEEKRLLDFILEQDRTRRVDIVDYINSLSAEEIIRDYSDSHIIIEFRGKNTVDGYSGMSPLIQIQTVRKDGCAPTVFTLYSKDGHPFEYEIYNADSSSVNIETILSGKIIKNSLMTKNEVISGALALNGDYKDYTVTTEGDKIIIEAKYNSHAIHNRTGTFRCVAHLNDDNTYTEVHYASDSGYSYYGKFVGMQKSVSFSFGKKNGDNSIVKEEFNSEKVKKVLRDYLESCGYKRTNKGFFKRLFGK